MISSNPDGLSPNQNNMGNISPARSTTSLSDHRVSQLTSTSTFSSSSAGYPQCSNETITTISHLFVQPSLPGEEPRVSKEHLMRVLRYKLSLDLAFEIFYYNNKNISSNCKE